MEGRLTADQSFQIITITIILANYQKNEANNIYLQHLKDLDDPIALKVWKKRYVYVFILVNHVTLGIYKYPLWCMDWR